MWSSCKVSLNAGGHIKAWREGMKPSMMVNSSVGDDVGLFSYHGDRLLNVHKQDKLATN